MILLAIVSILLFFTTYFTGVFAEKLLKRNLSFAINNNFFETFLYGLITSFVYFNLLSFFLPINYLVLIPLLVISLITFCNHSVRLLFFAQCRQANTIFFAKKNLFFVIPFI